MSRDLSELEAAAGAAVEEAFRLGREMENERATWQRRALIDVAKLVGYPNGNAHHGEQQALEFVEWVRREAGQEGRALWGGALHRIIDLLWQGRPGTPADLDRESVDAVVDAVRVLLESANECQRQLKESRQEVWRAAECARRLDSDLTALQLTHKGTAEQNVRLIQALDSQYQRGYEAALKDVSKAARKMAREEVIDGKAGDDPISTTAM